MLTQQTSLTEFEMFATKIDYTHLAIVTFLNSAYIKVEQAKSFLYHFL